MPEDEPFGLPNQWSWTRLGNAILELRYDVDGVPVLRIPNVSKGRVDIDNLKFTKMPDKELADLSLQDGDLLMIRSNGSVSLVGRSATVEQHAAGFAFAGYLVRLRTMPDQIDVNFVHLALETRGVRDQVELPIRTTSGVKNINSTEIGWRSACKSDPLRERNRRVNRTHRIGP
jgi:type I restriction enzyme S subunit